MWEGLSFKPSSDSVYVHLTTADTEKSTSCSLCSKKSKTLKTHFFTFAVHLVLCTATDDRRLLFEGAQ